MRELTRPTNTRATVEVLMATMARGGLDFLDDLGISSDVLVVNQADSFGYTAESRAYGRVRMITMPERGVGLSRNTALVRATGDLCLLADDDIALSPNYPVMVSRAFERNHADLIVFNLDNAGSGRRHVEAVTRIGWSNYMNFGAPRIAFRRDSVWRERISFSLEFGGGARYSAGEDSLFLRDCLGAGLKVVAVPDAIGTVLPSESSWFEGHNDKYFRDRGALYAALAGKGGYPLALRFALRHRAMFAGEATPGKALRSLIAGVREYRKTRR